MEPALIARPNSAELSTRASAFIAGDNFRETPLSSIL
jgi:hypothetical protein